MENLEFNDRINALGEKMGELYGKYDLQEMTSDVKLEKLS
jgi:hypothetical protein